MEGEEREKGEKPESQKPALSQRARGVIDGASLRQVVVHLVSRLVLDKPRGRHTRAHTRAGGKKKREKKRNKSKTASERTNQYQDKER